jgi:hypothetical protein
MVVNMPTDEEMAQAKALVEEYNLQGGLQNMSFQGNGSATASW